MPGKNRAEYQKLYQHNNPERVKRYRRTAAINQLRKFGYIITEPAEGRAAANEAGNAGTEKRV